eukprot:15442-Heterococcus_DN1.PRE.2
MAVWKAQTNSKASNEGPYAVNKYDNGVNQRKCEKERPSTALRPSCRFSLIASPCPFAAATISSPSAMCIACGLRRDACISSRSPCAKLRSELSGSGTWYDEPRTLTERTSTAGLTFATAACIDVRGFSFRTTRM